MSEKVRTVRQIRGKDLSILQRTYIPEIVKGMMLTLKQVFRPKFTRQYPEERRAPRWRSSPGSSAAQRRPSWTT